MEAVNVLMMLLLFASAHAQLQQSKMSAADQKLMVDRHNEVRRLEYAANMREVSWNGTLAAMAQWVADGCNFEHSHPPRSSWRHLVPWDQVGQNLAAVIGKTLSEVLQGWYDEKSDYTFETGACTPGRLCGHYTQVVWGDTQYIGCGMTQCNELRRDGHLLRNNALYVVCNYGPPGNYIDQQLYQRGPACSACPSGTFCNQKLCRTYGAPKPEPPVVTQPPVPQPPVVTEAPQISGRWGQWSEYGPCSVTCGVGSQSRSRECNGFDCVGDRTSTRACSTECPESDTWDVWGFWHSCSTLCRQFRYRSCPSDRCQGVSYEIRQCTGGGCVSVQRLGEWGAWSDCSVSCGKGTRMRIRECINGNCPEDLVERTPCDAATCFTSGNAEFSDWSAWECDKTCGIGTKTRTRRCVSEGGCEGPTLDVASCSMKPCPDTPLCLSGRFCWKS